LTFVFLGKDFIGPKCKYFEHETGKNRVFGMQERRMHSFHKLTHQKIKLCAAILILTLAASGAVAQISPLSALNLKAIPGRDPGQDSFTLIGNFTVEPIQLEGVPITIKIGPYSQTINASMKGTANPIFFFTSRQAGITSALLYPSRDKFVVLAKNISLAGLTNPVTVEISTPSYHGVGQAALTGKNTLLFLRGAKNTLDIGKVNFKLGSGLNQDSLAVTGSITTQDYNVNLAAMGMTIIWGSYSTTIPQNSFVSSGGHKWTFKAPANSNSDVKTAAFDFRAASYSIAVKNAEIGAQFSPVIFRLEFDNFDEMVSRDIPNNPPSPHPNTMTVLGYNDLGMHCMNEDFSEMMILPPFNTIHAQIINPTGEDPQIVTSGVSVTFNIPSNTTSVDKTNFWTYAQALIGHAVPPDVGLTGTGLSGAMQATPGGNDWSAVGIPLTPLDDNFVLNPYQSAVIRVSQNGSEVGNTQAVVPVSWEISCNLCHNTPGVSAATDILQKHDQLHGTNLVNSKPVRCSYCHAQAPLAPLNLSTGPDFATTPSLSRSMHSAHASRFTAENLAAVNGVACYACHPGIETKCLRDVHFAKGLLCENCHGTMTDVADPARRPWVDEPRCDSCHNRAGFQFEQPGTLYRNSVGHNGVNCPSCHGSPHAITPTIIPADNVQAINVQGHAGTINKCSVCHGRTPDDAFNHTRGESGN
jgi:hypothetical protein